MRFDFEPLTSPSVRIIEVIESHPISRLEGRNGAGKTMAVRLLQLCCGDHAYAKEEGSLWRELKSRLGPVRVTCTHLNGASSIVWNVNPERWPERPEEDFAIVGADAVEPAICSTVVIDGNPADDRDVRALLRVHRLIGDETLIDSLRGEISSLQRRVERERQRVARVADVVRPAFEQLDELGAVLRIKPQGEYAQAVSTAQAALEASRLAVHAAEARRDLIRDLRIRKTQLAELESDDRDPDEHRQSLREELREVRDNLVRLRSEQRALNLRAEADARITEAIADLERRITEHEAARDEALEDFVEAVGSVGLAGLTPDDETGVLREARERAQTRVSELRAIQARLDAGPQIIQLGDAVLRVLNSREYRDLKELPLVETEASATLTPVDIASGIDRHRAELAREGDPPHADRLRAELARAELEREKLDQATGAVRRYRRRRTEIGKARASIREQSANLASEEGVRFAALEEEIAALSEREEALQGELDQLLHRLAQLGGGTSLATMRRRLQRDITQAGLDADALDSASDEALSAVEDAISARGKAEAVLREAAEAQNAFITRRTNALIAAADPNVWWHSALAALVHDEPTPEDADRLGLALQEIASSASARLDDVDQVVEAVRAGLTAAEDGRRPDVNPSASLVLESVERRLGDAYFGQEAIAEALLGGGRLERLDLVDERIDWVDANGAAASRPLAAFSSGERAFAYTQARLQRLRDERPVANRFVVLDEFGAFLERARLDLLQTFLHDEVLGALADQILIVLPLPTSPSTLTEDERARRYRILPL